MLERETLLAWFAGRIPDAWFPGGLDLSFDRDEILVVGTLQEPDVGADAGEDARKTACRSRIEGFREDTRTRRIEIAAAAERRYERKVSWGARCGPITMLFTHLSIPAMTRLRLPERLTLDTLVDAGVARSRSDALAWCVRLVAKHEGEWIRELREAMVAVEEVRRRGPA